MSLKQLIFTRLDANLRDVGTITAQYNPTEFSMTKGVQYAEIGIPGIDMPVQQFVQGQAETMSLDLFFDTTEYGMGTEATVQPVTILTDQFYQLVQVAPDTGAPPICRVSWAERGFPGSNSGTDEWAKGRRDGFTCLVENVTQKFTLFSPNGIPLRATLSVKLREYQTLEQQIKAIKMRSTTVAENQTLDELASRAYNDPTRWREIADANGIEDPLDVAAGTIVDIPW